MNSMGAPTEPSITMTRKDKRDLILAAVAIVVAVIVVGALIVPPPPPPEEPVLKATITPDTVSLAAGQTVALELSLTIGDHTVLYPTYEYEWQVNPDWLGEIHEPGPSTFYNPKYDFEPVKFTAGRNALSGNVTCTVTYQEQILIAVTNVTVGPPVIEHAKITPSDYQMLVGRNMTFELEIQNSLDERVSDFNASWSLSGMNSTDFQINRTTGESITFMPKVPGHAELTAYVEYESFQQTCNSTIEAITAPPRSVNYRWYDMFNVSFGSWYEKRWPIYRNERRITDSYPWLLETYRGGGIIDTYGGMRLNITGRNLTEVSMNERPEFLPFLGTERGGTVVIDWYMQYLTADELADRYDSFAALDDGWIIVLNGTVTLDKQAAKAVLNLTDEGYNDFDGWWDDNIAVVVESYSLWIVPSVTFRIEFENTYGSYFQLFTFGLQAERVGNEIVLTYDLVTWGMEVLMMKWLHEAFLSTEWWFEDMTFRAKIGPCFSDFDIDAAVPHAIRASNSTQTGQACWIWEGMLQTPVPYDLRGWPWELYLSPYYQINEKYMDMGSWVLPWDPMPGGLPFTHTPGSFNLSDDERLKFEWPAANVLFMSEPFHQNSTNTSAEMVLSYSEPNQTDASGGQINLNLTGRYLEFVGAFDFWSWSKNQTSHAYLADKWQLFGLLPYGMPYLEFWAVS